MAKKDSRFGLFVAWILITVLILLAVPVLVYAWDRHQCTMQISSAGAKDSLASAAGLTITTAYDAAIRSPECLSTQDLDIWFQHKTGRK